MAVILEDENKMMCVRIDKIETNEDDSLSDLKEPATTCLLEGNV